jgi:hypothetical protein
MRVLAMLDYAQASIFHAFLEYREQLLSAQRASERYRAVGDLLGLICAQIG